MSLSSRPFIPSCASFTLPLKAFNSPFASANEFSNSFAPPHGFQFLLPVLCISVSHFSESLQYLDYLPLNLVSADGRSLLHRLLLLGNSLGVFMGVRPPLFHLASISLSL